MTTTRLAHALVVLSSLLPTACLDAHGGPTPSTRPARRAPWDLAAGGYEEEFDRSFAVAGGGGAGGAMATGMEEGGAPTMDGALADPGEVPSGDVGPAGGAALEGGEIDDNELWDAYLGYVAEHAPLRDSDPSVHWLDVSRRFFIRVTDSTGATTPGARVQVSTHGRLLTDGLTLADGRLAFHPGAHGAADSDGPFDVRVTLGDLSTTTTVDVRALTTEAILDGPAPREPLKLDVAFVIDSTGSMGEEIARIQQTILDIADHLEGSEFEPDLRMGLVEYRDRGDDFVTHTVNLTSDIQAFERAVAALTAGGGGDFPEDLNAALERTMNRLEWREGRALRLTFVVADAPPHHYDDADYTYDQAMLDAHAQGIKVFPIASGGSDGPAEFVFRQLAQFTQGRFVFITEGGGSRRGSGGSDYDVDEADFRVERLDRLVVRLVSEEMAAWTER